MNEDEFLKPFDIELDASDLVQITEEWAMRDPTKRTALVLTHNKKTDLYKGGGWGYDDDKLVKMLMMIFAQRPTLLQALMYEFDKYLKNDSDE